MTAEDRAIVEFLAYALSNPLIYERERPKKCECYLPNRDYCRAWGYPKGCCYRMH